ncbi:flagellin [Sporosarcina sp. HYO08]|uniref:flagellin N-terminal helical domain-containing protein n=1 Tax=Sporosarcina sp. HYO08 TaxID=1759557 RepID=UPI00079919F3|nr:flagellin [Sporosarcina sp. HYO08]KXH84142.1 hypothetical protein AU377_05205 [Sporosarcina sp. HYO08]
MRINHNIAALNTYRQLNSAAAGQAKSMEKLSSGLRINRAGDDAAGLAISEKMRGQIRGLDMAARNSQDGISMIQTAEGALNETHDILQRMKELATQAANSTNTNDDREKIQEEISQLSSEINRIGNTTEFNTKKVLNGNVGGGSINANATTAKLSGGANAEQAQYKITVDGASTDGQTVEFDGVKFEFHDTSGSIVSGNVHAGTTAGSTAASNTLNLFEAMRNSTLNTNWDITMNEDGEILATAKKGQSKDGVAGNSTGAASFTGVTGTSSQEVTGVDAIKAEGEITFNGKPENGSYIKIGDQTIAFFDSSKQNQAAIAQKFVDEGSVSPDAFVDTHNKNLATILEDLQTEVGNGGTAEITSTTDFSVRIKATTAGEGLEVSGTGNFADTSVHNALAGVGSDAIKLQVGANANQSFSVDISDMRSVALGITGTTGDVQAGGVTGAKYTATGNVTDGTSNSKDEYALDVMSHESATAAITVIDNAINEVSKERAKLGSFQNRLDHTINNLNTSSENLTAAESRIRDVDYALAA